MTRGSQQKTSSRETFIRELSHIVYGIDIMKLEEIDFGDQDKKGFKKEILKDYLEEHPDRLFCVHNISDSEEVPLTKSYEIAGFLEDFEGEGVLEMVRKESCAFKNYPHNTYKFVPKKERKKEEENMVKQKPTRENVFKAIKSRYDEGDKFKSTKIMGLWSNEERDRASQVIYNLSKTNLIDKVDKSRKGRNAVNIYELKEADYGKRKAEKRETEEKNEYHECPYCDYVTDKPQGLGGHMRWKHPDKVEGVEEETEEEYKPVEELGKIERVEVPRTRETASEKFRENDYQKKKELLALKIVWKVLN